MANESAIAERAFLRGGPPSQVIEKLSKLRDLEHMAIALHNRNHEVVEKAAQLLSERGKEALPYAPILVKKALSNPHQKVRIAAYAALTHMGPEAALHVLEALKDRNPDVRMDAARTLDEIGNSNENILEALRGALGKEDDMYAAWRMREAIKSLQAKR